MYNVYNFNEIAHFYLGAKGLLITKIHALNNGHAESETTLTESWITQLRNDENITFKPYLRSLEDLTDEECLELGRLSGRMPLQSRNDDKIEVYNNTLGNKVISWGDTIYDKLLVYQRRTSLNYTLSQITYLLLKRFDIYNLIDNNQAILIHGKENDNKGV